jgi:hypothetical protein
MENQGDLFRLCVLMHAKNVLVTEKNSARKRTYVRKDALSLRQNKSHEKGRKRWAKANGHEYKVEPYITAGMSLRDARVPAKYKKMTMCDLQIVSKEAIIAEEMARLAIYQWTKANRKEIKDICKRNGWRVRSSYTGGYDGVWQSGDPNGLVSAYYTHIIQNKKEIHSRAMIQLLEDAIVKS